MSKAFVFFSASNLYVFIIDHINFHSIISIIRQVMANKAKSDQIVALKTEGAT